MKPPNQNIFWVLKKTVLATAGLEDQTPLAHQLGLINSPDTPSPQWEASVPQDLKKIALINSVFTLLLA